MISGSNADLAPTPASTPEAVATYTPDAAANPLERARQWLDQAREHTHQVRGRTLVAAGLAISGALGATLSPHEAPPKPTAITIEHDTLVDHPLPEKTEVCPLTNVEVVNVVRVALLGNPTTNTEPLTSGQFLPPFEVNEAEVPTMSTDQFPSSAEIQRYKLAKKYGLTQHTAAPYRTAMQEVRNDPNTTNAERFASDFAQTKAYLRDFGVSLEIGTKKDDLAYGAHTPTKAELEDDLTAGNLWLLMSAFSRYTQEYVDMSGVRRIVLVADAHKRNQGEAKGSRWQNVVGYISGDVVALDMKDVIMEDVVDHEFGHGIGDSACGGATEQDPSWVGRNEGIPYSDNATQSYERFEDKLDDMIRKAARANPDTEDPETELLACDPPELVSDIGQGVAFVRDYGGKNPDEDWATFSEAAYRPDWISRMIGKATPILREKFIAYFARIAQYRPNLALFLIAQRPPSSCEVERSTATKLHLSQPRKGGL